MVQPLCHTKRQHSGVYGSLMSCEPHWIACLCSILGRIYEGSCGSLAGSHGIRGYEQGGASIGPRYGRWIGTCVPPCFLAGDLVKILPFGKGSNLICLYDDLSTNITEFHTDVSPKMALMYCKLSLLSKVGGLSLVYTTCARTSASR